MLDAKIASFKALSLSCKHTAYSQKPLKSPKADDRMEDEEEKDQPANRTSPDVEPVRNIPPPPSMKRLVSKTPPDPSPIALMTAMTD